MPVIDVRKRRIVSKIVYYGAGLCGKTANLKFIHDHLDAQHRGRLVSLSVKAEGAQQIDLLPVRTGKIKGFDIIHNLCTVPGQSLYNKTRKLVLKGTDGVVFVADSAKSRLIANVDALQNLRENLLTHDVDLEGMLHVIQYNKRDLPDALPVSELRAKLNPHGVLEFEASIKTGVGVMETLKAIVSMVREDVEKRL